MKFKMQDAPQVARQENPNFVSYFSLKNDGDSSVVRFMYDSIDDVEGHFVHKLPIRGGKTRWAECLKKDYSDPDNVCPICETHDQMSSILQRIWIPLWDVAKNEPLFWERGPVFWSETLLPLMQEKCMDNKHFCGYIFRITRYGVAGDSDTKYEITEISYDDTTIDKFEKIPNPTESFHLDRSFEELANYVKTGNLYLPKQTSSDSGPNQNVDFPIRRRDSSVIPPRRGVRPDIT